MLKFFNLGGHNDSVDNVEKDVGKGDLKRKIDGVELSVTVPENQPIRMTYIITESNVSEDSYKTIQETLLSLHHVVVLLALSPWKMQQHDLLAHLIHTSFHERFKDDFQLQSYGIIGHGIGGKIALLVPCLYPRSKTLKVVMALDPVDESPTMFTSPENNNNHFLPNDTVSTAKFFVTSTQNARGTNKNNGVAICRRNRNLNVKFIDHDGGNHLSSYCDRENVGYLCQCQNDGNKKRNEKVFRHTMKLIKTNFYWTDQEEESKNEEDDKEKDDSKLRRSGLMRFSLFERNENGKKDSNRKVTFSLVPSVRSIVEHEEEEKEKIIADMESRKYDKEGHMIEKKKMKKRKKLKKKLKKLVHL